MRFLQHSPEACLRFSRTSLFIQPFPSSDRARLDAQVGVEDTLLDIEENAPM